MEWTYGWFIGMLSVNCKLFEAALKWTNARKNACAQTAWLDWEIANGILATNENETNRTVDITGLKMHGCASVCQRTFICICFINETKNKTLNGSY